MNNVSLIGRFVKDPELRYSENGTAICNFTLAVRNPFKPDDADFIPCVAWQAGAELVAEKHEKGNMIGVDGRIATRYYDKDDGQRVWVTEVNVSSIHLIQTKDYAENQQNGNGNGNGNGNQRNQRNGNGNQRNQRNGSGNGNGRNNR